MPTNLWQGTWRGRSPDGSIHTRARNVISPSGGIVRGKFPSRKTGRMIHHEGLLELDAIYLLEASPLVETYKEQPRTLYYPDAEKLRRYTPDFEVVLATGESVLIEVKPSRSLACTEVQQKLACISAHMRRLDQPFVTLDERALRLEPRQSNLRRIYHRAPRRPLPISTCAAAVSYLANRLPLSIDEASKHLRSRGVDPYSLLLSALLRCDLDISFSTENLLYLSTEADDDWFRITQGYGF